MAQTRERGHHAVVWEEAYGYAGIEFLATGIPVIANAIGGMPEYVREGETGWLNTRCDADGLAATMRHVIEQPEQIAELNATLLTKRDSIVLSMSRHADEMGEIYRQVMAEAHNRAPGSDRLPRRDKRHRGDQG